MKANSTYPITAFLLAVILCAVSCMQEEILEPQQEKAVFTIVGNPVEVHLGITVNDLEVGVGTRAEEPTTYEMETVEEERHVDDLWLGFTDNGMNPNNLTNVNYCEDKSGLYGMYMYMTGGREGNMSFFPTQGTRQANGAAYKIGNCGNYHNATADSGGRVNIMHIHDSDVSFKIFENTSTAYYLKSVASPVRCVRTATVVQQ